MTILPRIPRVPPSPSKIPYGGFSPVRLQTEILPPPSASRQELSAARIPPANASPISCRDALQSINPARSLAAGYGHGQRGNRLGQTLRPHAHAHRVASAV